MVENCKMQIKIVNKHRSLHGILVGTYLTLMLA
jgi:hypothetical protein